MQSRAIAIALLASTALLVRAADDYVPGPDSKPQDGVPKGELLKFNFEKSKVFPGTTREVNVYIPPQYDPAKPACLYVNQDGIQWNAPVVFDNLIHKKEMPVTIGVFVMHGRVKASNTNALDRFNRSYEYDGLGDGYARFLIEELLPEVERMKTTDGRAIRLSKDPNDRAIGGSSSGAICAFTAAWERPDAFRRVFSTIGTYVGLRGGHEYSTLIRKYEPKPLRIFLQDGANDLNIYAGNWWMANQAMERSLVFSGYEVEHVWGEGMHSGKHGTAIFPDAMRWLWKDWPQPVKAGASKNGVLSEILLAGQSWQLVSEGHKFTEGPAVNSKGEVFFNDIPASKTYKVALDGKVSEFIADSKKGNGQHFGADGRLYAVAAGESKVLAYDAAGKPTDFADGISGNDLVAAHNGNLYVTQPRANGPDSSSVSLIRPDGSKQVVDAGVRMANGVTLSPDQSLLYVADTRSHWVYSYQIQPDGALQNKQRYFWLHVPDDADDSGADGLRADREGRLYVATRMGIQICDQPGRVNAILPLPNGRSSNLCFGGENFDTLFVTAGDKVFKRKLNTKGAQAWDAPSKPGPPRL